MSLLVGEFGVSLGTFVEALWAFSMLDSLGYGGMSTLRAPFVASPSSELLDIVRPEVSPAFLIQRRELATSKAVPPQRLGFRDQAKWRI